MKRSKPITAAEFRELVRLYHERFSHHYEALLDAAADNVEHIALALELYETKEPT